MLYLHMGWPRLIGSLKLYVSSAEHYLLKGSIAKETYNFKEHTNRIHPTPYVFACPTYMHMWDMPQYAKFTLANEF